MVPIPDSPLGIKGSEKVKNHTIVVDKNSLLCHRVVYFAQREKKEFYQLCQPLTTVTSPLVYYILASSAVCLETSTLMKS